MSPPNPPSAAMTSREQILAAIQSHYKTTTLWPECVLVPHELYYDYAKTISPWELLPGTPMIVTCLGIAVYPSKTDEITPLSKT